MSELKWYWVYVPYLDPPDRQQESALRAGYNKVCFKYDADAEIRKAKRALWLARIERAMAESYSVLNDVRTANKWAKIITKLKAKAEEYV